MKERKIVGKFIVTFGMASRTEAPITPYKLLSIAPGRAVINS